MKLVFVCLGNICRSPLAEGVFKKLVEEKGLQEVIICDSAGTASYYIGELADPRTRKNARSHGIDLTHCARAFRSDDFHDFDYIIPMDGSNMQHINRVKPAAYKAKIVLLRDFDPEGKGLSVPDPYYGTEKDFEEVYQIVYRSCKHFLDCVIKEQAIHDSL
jgi:protein-tyrosine phosphatase